jgi:F0F1-type ATP synthase membrane subunit c/vacuolar-type H+-ATPase subunit K
MQIYVHRNNQQIGPLTEAEVKAQLASGALSPKDHVWWSGQPGWVPLAQSPFVGAASSTPPVYLPPSPHEHASALAIASLLSNLVCGIGSVVAIVLGHMSLSAIKRNPSLQGKGFAVAGLAIGYTITALCIIQIVVIATLFALRHEFKETFNKIAAQVQDSDDSNDSTNSVPSNSSDTNSPPVITP